MSLPSQVVFLKDDEIVAKVFINVGWWVDYERLPFDICDAVNEYYNRVKNPDYDGDEEIIDFGALDYDQVMAYDKVFTRENFHKWYTQQITLEELLETVEDYIWPEERHKRRKRKYRKRIGLED